MLRKLRPRSVYDVCAALALFVALGGTAYAVNTVGSTDIIDGQVKSVDIGNNEIGSSDVKDGSLNTFDVHSFIGEDVIDGTLTGADLANGSIGLTQIGTAAVASEEVVNDSLTGTDIATGAVGSDEVANNSLGNGDFLDQSVDSRVVTNNSLLSSDLSTDSVGGDEVTNNSLDDQDIAQGTFVNFEAVIGTIPQGFCGTKEITGVTATGDHLVLTASQADASPVLSYTAEYSTNGSAWIKVCNPANFDVNDGNTHFNLLVIDAQ